jgi:hypothetical protein
MNMKTQRNAAVGAVTLFVGKHLARRKAKKSFAQNLWVSVGAATVAVAGTAGALAFWKTRAKPT